MLLAALAWSRKLRYFGVAAPSRSRIIDQQEDRVRERKRKDCHERCRHASDLYSRDRNVGALEKRDSTQGKKQKGKKKGT